MKRFIALSFGLWSLNSFAQGTLEFRVRLDGTQAVPATASARVFEGAFYLSNNHFHGNLLVDDWYYDGGVTSIRIFEAADSASYGTPRLDMVRTAVELPEPSLGFPGAQFYSVFSTPLTQADVTSLMAGNWYVNLSTFDHPTGELRGRITLVPEPSISTLLLLSGVPLLLAKGRGRR